MLSQCQPDDSDCVVRHIEYILLCCLLVNIIVCNLLSIFLLLFALDIQASKEDAAANDKPGSQNLTGKRHTIHVFLSITIMPLVLVGKMVIEEIRSLRESHSIRSLLRYGSQFRRAVHAVLTSLHIHGGSVESTLPEKDGTTVTLVTLAKRFAVKVKLFEDSLSAHLPARNQTCIPVYVASIVLRTISQRFDAFMGITSPTTIEEPSRKEVGGGELPSTIRSINPDPMSPTETLSRNIDLDYIERRSLNIREIELKLDEFVEWRAKVAAWEAEFLAYCRCLDTCPHDMDAWKEALDSKARQLGCPADDYHASEHDCDTPNSDNDDDDFDSGLDGAHNDNSVCLSCNEFDNRARDDDHSHEDGPDTSTPYCGGWDGLDDDPEWDEAYSYREDDAECDSDTSDAKLYNQARAYDHSRDNDPDTPTQCYGGWSGLDDYDPYWE